MNETATRRATLAHVAPSAERAAANVATGCLRERQRPKLPLLREIRNGHDRSGPDHKPPDSAHRYSLIPRAGRGTPPLATSTAANLDREPDQTANLNFKVPTSFHSDFAIFAIRHRFKSQTVLLHEAFALIKKKYEGTE